MPKDPHGGCRMVFQAAFRLALVVVALFALAHVPASSADTQIEQHGAIQINQPSPDFTGQDLQVFDAGVTGGRGPTPIFAVPPFGDVGVFGTGFSVYPPGDVYRPVASIGTDGTVISNGVRLRGNQAAPTGSCSTAINNYLFTPTAIYRCVHIRGTTGDSWQAVP